MGCVRKHWLLFCLWWVHNVTRPCLKTKCSCLFLDCSLCCFLRKGLAFSPNTSRWKLGILQGFGSFRNRKFNSVYHAKGKVFSIYSGVFFYIHAITILYKYFTFKPSLRTSTLYGMNDEMMNGHLNNLSNTICNHQSFWHDFAKFHQPKIIPQNTGLISLTF